MTHQGHLLFQVGEIMKYRLYTPTSEKRNQQSLDIVHQIAQIDKDIAYFQKHALPEIREENVKRLNAEKAGLLKEAQKLLDLITKKNLKKG